MPTQLLPSAYERLVDEDIQWLEGAAPDTLERQHIIDVLRHAVVEYRVRGYDEGRNRTGPHHPHRRDHAVHCAIFDPVRGACDCGAA